MLGRPLQLGHGEGDRVLRRRVRLGRPAAGRRLRRLLHVHEGRQAHRRLHGQRRRAGFAGRVGRASDDRRRGRHRGPDARQRRSGAVRADAGRRERPLHGRHGSGWSLRRRLGAGPDEGLRGHRRERHAGLVRAAHPGVRRVGRVLPRRLRVGHPHRRRRAGVPLHDARRGRERARRDHGLDGPRPRRDARLLDPVLPGRRRRRDARGDHGRRRLGRPRGGGHALRPPRRGEGLDRHGVQPRGLPRGRTTGARRVRAPVARPGRGPSRGRARGRRRGRRPTRSRPTSGRGSPVPGKASRRSRRGS